MQNKKQEQQKIMTIYLFPDDTVDDILHQKVESLRDDPDKPSDHFSCMKISTFINGTYHRHTGMFDRINFCHGAKLHDLIHAAVNEALANRTAA